MTKRRTAWILLAGATVVLLAWGAVRFARTRPAAARVPALVSYASLPAAFNQALAAAYAPAGDPPVGRAAAVVRRLAHLYQANRLFPQARACYAVLAGGAPGLTAEDHYLLADLAQNENDLAAAQAELRTVLAAADYLPARLTLADALFKSGQEDAAAKEYAAVIAKEANQPQASVGLARIELQRGEDDAAVARLERLLAAHPDAIAGAALLAKVLERRGQADRALALSQWSQQKPPVPLPDPWLEALLADCYDVQRLSITFEEYFKTGRMEAAVPLLDRLGVLDPQGPITMMFAGVSHAKALQHITAVREYYAALAQGGDPEKICPYLVQSLLAMNNATEAATVIAGYYRKMPQSIPLAKAYADVALAQDDSATARPLLEQVLRHEPYLQAQNMSLARIAWAAGEYDAAAACLQRVAAAYPNDLPSRALLGEYYLRKSDAAAAIKVLEPARALAPAHSPGQQNVAGMLVAAYLQGGNAAAEHGRLAAADAFADQAIALAPSDLNAYALKAGVAVQGRQFQVAAGALEKLATLDPANPTVHLSLGDVLYQGGDAGRAKREWQAALERAPAGEADIRQALQDRLDGKITDDTFK